jgi:hypothetical protein
MMCEYLREKCQLIELNFRKDAVAETLKPSLQALFDSF